ncbi:MAG: hypothetical protein ABIQ95_04150 [Bdellovibrionia bacterium]
MKKNILMAVVLNLSLMAVASASTAQFAIHLGEEKLSEISSGSFKCEFARGNVSKEVRNVGISAVSAPASRGSSKAGIAR